MAYNGSGVFSRLYNFVTDRNGNIKIRADRMDAELDGFATGLSTAITRNGQSTISAAIPFNDNRITGLGNAAAGTDAMNRNSCDARYLELDGTTTMTGPVLAANGTVSAPGVTFGSDLDSGLYRIDANNIGVAVNGAKVLDVATTGLGVTGTLASTAGVSGTTGVFTGAITMQTRLVDAFPTGTKMLFRQTAAPTGWTKDTTHTDAALRVTSGTISEQATGGKEFSTLFAARTIARANLPNDTVTVTVTITDPGHTHTEQGSSASANVSVGGSQTIGPNSQNTGSATTGITASGSFGLNGSTTQTTVPFDVNFVDIIIASKT